MSAQVDLEFYEGIAWCQEALFNRCEKHYLDFRPLTPELEKTVAFLEANRQKLLRYEQDLQRLILHYCKLAEFYLLDNRFEGAYKVYRQAHELNQENSYLGRDGMEKVIYRIALKVRLTDKQAAFQDFSFLTDEQVRDVNCLAFVQPTFERAAHLHDEKDYSGAASVYEEAVALALRLGCREYVTVSLLTRLGDLYVRAKDFDSAYQSYRKAADLTRNSESQSDRMRLYKRFATLSLRKARLHDALGFYLFCLKFDRLDRVCINGIRRILKRANMLDRQAEVLSWATLTFAELSRNIFCMPWPQAQTTNAPSEEMAQVKLAEEPEVVR